MTGFGVLLCAFGFAMIFECMLPMISPKRWKSFLKTLEQVPDSVIQKLGMAGVAGGLLVIWIIQSGLLNV